jgi:hypothetical protein
MKYSYIITHRSASQYRHRNLLAVIEWLKDFKDIEIIVVEQDSVPKIKNELPEHVNYIFAYNAGLFCKAWGFNIGANASTGQILIFSDNDIILNKNNFLDFLQKSKTSTFCTPHKFFYVKLSEAETSSMLNNLNDIKMPAGKSVPRMLGIITGGIFSITRNAYFEIGGSDENFRGWGGEDTALREKLFRFKIKILILEYTAYHLYHEDTGGTVEGVYTEYTTKNYKNNLELLRTKYQKAVTDDMMRYIKQAGTLGNLNKFKNET